MQFTKQQIDTSRQKRQVTVISQEQYDAGPFCFGASYQEGSLKKVMSSLAEIYSSIPKEYRDSASCKIDSVGGYEGDHCACIEVSYYRPETDEEVDARLTQQAEKFSAIEAEERRTLDRLEKKYRGRAEKPLGP